MFGVSKSFLRCTNDVCSNLYCSSLFLFFDLLTLPMLTFYLAHGFISCIITFFKKKETYIYGWLHSEMHSSVISDYFVANF